jgi:tetratricopeptide (TPR) repeat protein
MDAWSAPPGSQPAASFALAREQLLKGEYDKAAKLYEELGRRPGEAVRAACGRSRVDLELGNYPGGIARLTALAEHGRSSADWHARLAALLSEIGRYEEAARHNRRALSIDDEHIEARWQLGQIYENSGRAEAAVRTYEPFEDAMTFGSLPDSAEALTYLGRGFLRFTTLTGHPNIVRRTKHVLREVYQEAFDYADALYWPARLAAAELLLEKHSLHEAKRDFKRICEQNPRAAAAHVGLGEIALEQWDFEEAEKQAEAALKINPYQVAARVLLAAVRMTERRYEDAAAVARQALETNPNSIEALGVLAAAQLRAGDKLASQDTQARALKINPKPSVMHHVLGVWLAAGRQFADARQHFAKAIEFAPTWPEPHTELGLLYMETGDEASARRVLEVSFALDSFNSRTFHVLDLLDRLETFARLSTEHFIIKYDEKQDAVVAPRFAEALEDMYDEVCDDFGFRPAKPTIIELFPDHLGFSVRITARPFIATVGACTGRVIALAAPRPESPFSRYNWKTVLRHEFAHTVTLGATENRIPHWMTEGLAVYEESPRLRFGLVLEPSPRSWGAKNLLSAAVRRDRLFTLETIDWGFVRPRHPGDRGQAYAQSEWMIEYIIERYGTEAIGRFLKAFRDGANQAAAFKLVLKTDQATFDRDFKTWAAGQVAKWDLPTLPVAEPDEIEAQLEEKPDDADLLARLALAELLDGERDAAEKAARQALDLNKNHVPALEALSHVLISGMLSEKEEAKRQALIDDVEPILRRLYDLDPENPAAIKYLGYVEQSREQWREAIQYLSRYQHRFPEDPDPYRRLAAIHLRREATDKALRQLEALSRLVNDEPAVARQIAMIYLDRAQPDQVAHWLNRAIESDPYDVDTHTALADAYREMRQFSLAQREYQVVCRLLPDEAIGYDGLSRVFRSLGNLEEAAAYQRKAEALRGKRADRD